MVYIRIHIRTRPPVARSKLRRRASRSDMAPRMPRAARSRAQVLRTSGVHMPLPEPGAAGPVRAVRAYRTAAVLHPAPASAAVVAARKIAARAGKGHTDRAVAPAPPGPQ